MSGSPKIVDVGVGLHIPAAPTPGRILMVLDMPIDWAMCREIGGEVDLCDPGFEAEITFALAQAGIGKAGAAGIDELREQRDQALAAVRQLEREIGEAIAQLNRSWGGLP